MHPWVWLGELGADLRYAVRTLVKSPAFVAVAVLSLSLGIGANTTIFTLVNAALLTPLPFKDVPRLVSVQTTDDERNPGAQMGTSRDNYVDLRNGNTVFEELAAGGLLKLNLSSGAGEPERITAELVTGNYFTTLGVSALVGRTFLRDEDLVERAKLVTVLGYALWQRRFGGDRSIVGRTVLLNNQPFLVVGVMPPAFRGTEPLSGTSLWVPYMTYPVTTSPQVQSGFTSRRFTFFALTGRLKPAVSLEQAEAQLKTVARQLAVAFPNDNGGRSVIVRPLGELDPATSRSVKTAVGLLITVVGLVLFIACINVANLLLARASVRQKEIALRQSLGASRPRLVRMFLTEGLLLAALSGAGGLLLARWSMQTLWAFRPPSVDAEALDLSLDLRVLAFTVAISCLTCLLFGLAPALKSSRVNVVSELRDRGTSGSAHGLALRRFLIMAQVALSLITVIGAGLFVRSLIQAEQIDPGFDVTRLAMLSIDLGAQGYTEAQGRVFEQQAMERAAGQGGIEAVAFADLVPLWGGGNTRSIYLEGQDPKDRRNGHIIPTGVVSASYFRTVGIPLVRGRVFTDADQAATRQVAVVNETMAKRFWPAQDALGRRVRLINTDYFEIVGIVKDSKYGSLGAPPTPLLYRPLTQVYQQNLSMLIRGDQPKAVLVSARRQVQELDPRLPITNGMTLSDALQQTLWAPRLAASLLAVLGSVSLVLAIIGIYGVTAYSVSRRTHEFGLRLAIGAGPRDIFRLVLGQSLRIVLGGVVVGVAASLPTTHLVAGLLYGSATDPVTFVSAPLILVAAALAATYLPARRATRITPMAAIQHE